MATAETASTAEALLDEISACLARVRTAERQYLALKEEATNAKKAWEGLVLELQAIIDDGASGQMRLPLAGDGDDAWRDETMQSLGVTGKLLEKLQDAGIRTLGDWTDWYGEGLARKPIKGLGDAMLEKIADLCERYWSAVKQS